MSDENTALQSELRYLDPKRTHFFRKDGDALKLTIEGECTYLKTTAACAFPLSDPDHFIGVRESDGPEIGVIRDIRELNHESRVAVEEELNKRYFTPVIKRFIFIKHEFGAVYFNAETDKGSVEFVVRGLRENIVEISRDRYLITDVDGNRFELPDASRLDQKSLVLWERLV